MHLYFLEVVNNHCTQGIGFFLAFWNVYNAFLEGCFATDEIDKIESTSSTDVIIMSEQAHLQLKLRPNFVTSGEDASLSLKLPFTYTPFMGACRRIIWNQK